MDGGQAGKADVAAVLQQPKRPPELKPLGKVHHGPPAALTGGKGGAGQHRVIGADPASQHNLQRHQRARHEHPQPQRRRQHGRLHAPHCLGMAHGLHAQQCQQHDATHQMQRDDGGKQLHGDRECAKRALQADPDQGESGPPRAHHGRRHRAVGPGTPPLQPGGHGQHNDQHANARGEVTVDHLHPGLAVRHRPGGHGFLRRRNVCARAHRAGAAVAARPVGAAQAGIRQPGESAEQHQIKSQEQGQHRQRLQTVPPGAAAMAPAHPGHRPERDHDAQQHQLRQRCKVVKRLGIHQGCPGRPASSHEDEARSRRSRSRLALPAPEASIRAGNRIIQLPIGSTT